LNLFPFLRAGDTPTEGAAVRRVRVLVANQPRLMRELVLATIADHLDIEVIGVTEEQASILEIVSRSHPDFVIITLDKSERRPDLCDLLLDRFPHLKVLALAAEQNSSIVYWANQDIFSNRVETSEEGILNTLRGHLAVDQPQKSSNSKVN